MEWQTVLLLIVVALVTIGYIIIGVLYSKKKKQCKKLQIENHKLKMKNDKLQDAIDDFLKMIELREQDDDEAVDELDDNLNFHDDSDITHD